MSHFATATAFVEHVWSVGVSSSCLLCFVRVLFCVLNVLCGLVLRLRRGLCCWLLVVVECSPLPDIPAPALPPLAVHSAPFPRNFAVLVPRCRGSLPRRLMMAATVCKCGGAQLVLVLVLVGVGCVLALCLMRFVRFVHLFLCCGLWACARCAYCVCIWHAIAWNDEYSLFLRCFRLFLPTVG